MSAGGDDAPYSQPATSAELVEVENPLPAPRFTHRRNISKACDNCRKRRVRCSGGVPCNACEERKLECEYAEPRDRRQSKSAGSGEANEQPESTVASKRKVSEVDEGAADLRGLISRLRNCESSEATQVVNLIRSNAPLDEIVDFVDSQPPDKRRSTLAEHETVREALREEEALHAARSSKIEPKAQRSTFISSLTDDPPILVPAKPWVNLENDDHFISHLICLWFTWSSTVVPYINRDLFVRDMKSQNLNSVYCSSFLVNIMCADACFMSDYPEACMIPGDRTSAGMHFYEVAKDEYEKSSGPPTPAFLAGLTGLSTVQCVLGKDRVALQTMRAISETVPTCKAMADMLIKQSSSEEEAVDLRRGTDQTLWGAFLHLSAAALTFEQGVFLYSPLASIPSIAHETSINWYPYPLTGPNTVFHFDCYFSRFCELGNVVCELCTILSPLSEHPASAERDRKVGRIMERLTEWLEFLPSCLHLKANVPPFVISVHAHCYWLLTVAAGSLRTRQESSVKTKDVAGYNESSSEVHNDEGAVPEGIKSAAHATCMNYCLKTLQLAQLHDRLWGFHRPAPSFLHYIGVAIFALLDALENPECRQAFVELCIYERACCRRFVLSRGIMRLVQLSAKNMKVLLPSEVIALFKDFELNDWSPHVSRRFTSLWPDIGSVFRNDFEDPTEIELDEVLKKYNGLNIEDPA